MKTIPAYFILLLLLVSCSSKQNIPVWGQNDVYPDFLWVKYTPVIHERSLYFDFNQDAKTSLKNPLVFRLYKESEDAITPVKKQEAVLFVNGVETDDNSFSVSTRDSLVRVGIRLAKSTAQGDAKSFVWFLRMEKNPGLHNINDNPVSSSSFDLRDNQTQIRLINNHKWNPLALILLIVLIAILSVLGVWFLILRTIIFPKIRFSTLQIVYFEDDSRKGAPTLVNLSGCRKVVLGTDPPEQGALSRLFTGRIETVVHPFWEHEVTLLPASEAISFSEKPDSNGKTCFSVKGLIQSINGPKRPYEVMKKGTNNTARLSIQ